MNLYRFRLAAAIAAAVLAFALLATFTSLLAPADNAYAAPVASDAASESATILARRAISIPYGLADVQELGAEGSQITVTGHAICWEESQMFDLRVTVAQSTTNAFAEGRSVDVCAGGERQIWDAETGIESSTPFEAGPARACAEVIELAQHGVADQQLWCKDVSLVQSNSND